MTMASSLSEVILQRGTDPALRLLAAVVAAAVDDARDGDFDALMWLRNDSQVWLSWLLPNHVDLATIHNQIVTYATPRRPMQRRLIA